MNKKFYVTTPIYYVNDRPHIGHAYTTVAVDVLSRWHKKQGEKVFFMAGTDEHGAKIEQAAAKNNQDVQKFVDEKAQAFKDAWQKLNIEYDNFLRTTDEAHVKAVQAAVQAVYNKGLIYKGEYEGLYCVGCEQYKFEDDLVDGKCREHNIEPQLMKEESYFFKLSEFGKVLEEKISSDELAILPQERKNEILNFLRSGLKDISISRKNVKWGIPLPFDEEQTIYVWIDAFLNYLTGLGWDGSLEFRVKSEKLEFFPPDLQLMSKDILRVHATIWPALLLALELPLPKEIFVHGYFTIDGQKMSKSLGNVIWPEELVEKFGVDGARYLLMSSLLQGQDSDVSWEKLTEKYNADLANGLGNLVSRVLTLSEKLKVKSSKSESKIENMDGFFAEIRLKEVLDEIWSQIAWANRYIEEKRLWELVKMDPKEGEKVLAELLSLISEIGEAIAPFMPETSENIKKMLETGAAGPLFPRV
ncbi:MAG: methionine--tRNA ligase [bacterium]